MNVVPRRDRISCWTQNQEVAFSGVRDIVRTMTSNHRQFWDRARVFLASLLVLALVLPSIPQALPRPSLSAEETLLRDLATSVCSQDGQSGESKSKHPNQSQHDCQLCLTCCALAGLVGNANSSVQTPFGSSVGAQRGFVADWKVPVKHPLADETGPPQGPPDFS